MIGLESLAIYYVNGLITIWIFIKNYYFQVFSMTGIFIIFLRELSFIKEKADFKRKVGYV